MNEAILELDSLVKRFGSRDVLQVERLVFQKGRIHGIIGPSGSGKSTLLRILNLIEKPSAGRVFFHGQDISLNNGRLAVQRRMAMVFQKPVMFNTTVFENVAYGLKVRGLRGPALRDRVRAELKTLGLEQLENQAARTLSGGEAQRVALARVLVTDPEVLFLDEPTSNLDPHNAALIEAMVRSVSRERGFSVVLVTHNIFQARRLTDWLSFLYEGKLIEEGPTPEILANPRDERTAAFVRGDTVY
ncbi:MAG: phosphate ABC transporter ATP-binding protein [Eubacteriales bacterium]|nr:phosphate ABC transporter ATP-binding protein [Bacillota bacterium]MBV1727647.1 phosphate ABC transporter ATP-binding protein [Desulforudis sp.]MDP3051171.1 phosphate ABC transporter ATP-binding protein [Eubacteriales bacterium]MDQ7789209.1 phosphate ABC transporter ATP-binding protein [Clostridia bacterium]MBU4532709.1 phosphate ABC transporter ATP-binding protein [Bacillota bacterium]